MDKLGFNSTHHMRRLKWIAEKDFGNVVTEYLKIGWFLIYSLFVGDEFLRNG